VAAAAAPHEPRQRLRAPWEALKANPGPWTYVKDNLLVDDETCASGYREFVYFLPYVQRFLYGFGEADAKTPSSLTVFRRDDIAQGARALRGVPAARARRRSACASCSSTTWTSRSSRIEIVARDLPLADAVEVMDRFGRPYPPSWSDPGRPRIAPPTCSSSIRRGGS
jgi:hypothetical protein